MTTSVSLNGSTFDTYTYGKDIIFLFWESSDADDRMFKSSAWDMLATEKDKHVSREIIVGDMDCNKNREFCSKWIAFDTIGLAYPYIAMSHNNEPFVQYNGSMAYPDLTDLLFEHFERNCVLNEKWCTEEERELLDRWDFMELEDLMKEHLAIQKETDRIVKVFDKKSAQIRDEFKRIHREVSQVVEERDKIAILLHTLISKSGVDAIQEVAMKYD